MLPLKCGEQPSSLRHASSQDPNQPPKTRNELLLIPRKLSSENEEAAQNLHRMTGRAGGAIDSSASHKEEARKLLGPVVESLRCGEVGGHKRGMVWLAVAAAEMEVSPNPNPQSLNPTPSFIYSLYGQPFRLVQGIAIGECGRCADGRKYKP